MKTETFSIKLIKQFGLNPFAPKVKKMVEDFEWYVDHEYDEFRNVVFALYRFVLGHIDLFIESDSISSGGGCSHLLLRTKAGRVLMMSNTCGDIELSGSKGWYSIDDFCNQDKSGDSTRGMGWEYQNPETIMSIEFDKKMKTNKVELEVGIFFGKVLEKIANDEPLPSREGTPWSDLCEIITLCDIVHNLNYNDFLDWQLNLQPDKTWEEAREFLEREFNDISDADGVRELVDNVKRIISSFKTSGSKSA